MKRKNLVSLVLMGALFGMASNIGANAMLKNRNEVKVSNCTNIDENAIKNYEIIEILGSKYDLSNIDPGVLQVGIRIYDEINAQKLTGNEKDKQLKPFKEMLDDYKKNPSKYENFPVTLDLGPSSLLREEIAQVQGKIKDLKNQQETVKKTKMHPKAIEEKVEELQKEINKFVKWINYSVVNFNSDEYKQTFCNEENKGENPVNNQVSKEYLFDFIDVNTDNKDVFRVIIKNDGQIKIEGKVSSENEVIQAVEKSIEFENLKVRSLLEEIEAIKLTKLPQIEKDNRISEINSKVQSVKAYGTAKEILLLNLTKSAVEKTRIAPEAMKEKIKEINDGINERINVLKEYNIDPDYVIEDSSIGGSASYFGYAFEDENGFAVQVDFNEDGTLEYENMESLNNEQKNILKKLASQRISETENKIAKLKQEKDKLEKEEGNNYYLIDGMGKNIDVLNNDINNYKFIISSL